MKMFQLFLFLKVLLYDQLETVGTFYMLQARGQTLLEDA